jgi:hypothetical protein
MPKRAVLMQNSDSQGENDKNAHTSPSATVVMVSFHRLGIRSRYLPDLLPQTPRRIRFERVSELAYRHNNSPKEKEARGGGISRTA